MTIAGLTNRLRRHKPALVAATAFAICLAVIVSWVWVIVAQRAFSEGVTTRREVANRFASRPLGELVAGSRIEQTLRATSGGLTALDIQMVTFSHQNDPDVIFELIEESQPDKVIRSVTVPPGAIQDNHYVSFQFPPVNDSTGKRYIARLLSPGGRPGDAFGAWAGACACYDEGNAMFNGEQLSDLDLVMQMRYSTGSQSVTKELIDRMSQYKPEYFKGIALVMIAFITIGFAAALIASFSASLVTSEAGDGPVNWRWLLASFLFLGLAIWIWRS